MKHFILCGLLVAASILSSCSSKEEKSTATEKQPYCLSKEFQSKIALEPISFREVTETLSLSGSIQYNEDDVVAIKSKLDGTVQHVYFTLGQYVNKGTVLAEIASTEVNNLVLDQQQIQHQLTLAQQKLKATQAMLADGLASERQVEEASMEVASLKAALHTQNSNLNYLNAGNKKGTFQIVAPKSGYVVEKNITQGMNLSKDDDVLLAISNLKEVWVLMNVYANQLPYIQKDATVHVTTLAYPDKVFKGKVAQLSQVFDREERVLKARVVLDNSDLMLKPGMSADLMVEKKKATEHLLALPNKAIIFDNNQQYVIVYQSPCEMKIQRVDAVAENATYTYVKDGFAAGDQVITENELLIFEELNN